LSLPVDVPFHDDEFPLSFASRLAAANGYPSLTTMLSLMGLNKEKVRWGDTAALEELARWTQADIERRMRYPSKADGNRIISLGHARFRTFHRDRDKLLPHCPSCVNDDISAGGPEIARPYIRAWWLMPFAEACPVHKCPLVSVPTDARFDNFDTARRLQTFNDVPDQAKALTFEPDLERYIVARIRGEQTNSFLDQIDVHIILEFCEHMSRDLTTRNSPRVRDSSAKRYAFHVASAGSEAIADTVSHLVESTRNERAVGGMYGWFSRHRHNDQLAPLLDAFRDGIARQLPLGPGNALMGPVAKRYLHTSETAAAEYSMHKSRVLELVTNAGLLYPDHHQNFRTPFDAVKAHDILAAATEVSSVPEIAKALGATLQRAQKLVEAGLVGSVSGERRRRLVSAVDARSLLERLKALAVSAATEDGLISFANAERTHRVDFVFLVRHAIEGKLGKIFWVSETCDFATLRLDASQLADRLSKIFGEEDGLTVPKTTHRLCISKKGVDFLCDNGHLTIGPQRPSRGLALRECVTQDSIRLFEKTYISLGAIAKVVGRRSPKLRHLLNESKIQPVIESEAHELTCYARADFDDRVRESLRDSVG